MTKQSKTTGIKNNYYCGVLRGFIITDLYIHFDMYAERSASYTSGMKSKRYWMSFSTINSKMVRMLIGKVD